MASGPVPETVVTQGYLASIPAAIRRRLGIEPGDVLVWEAEGNRLRVRVRKRRLRGFADFKPFDFGEATDAAEDHDEVV
jgi:bifunctional DNA-binding transcriptional regulator/antitoxin component of YhaV-PrlF toxin-antitoxin module